MNNETTPATPSVSPVDNDAERPFDALRIAWEIFDGNSGQHMLVKAIAATLREDRRLLDSRGAALRDALANRDYWRTSTGFWNEISVDLEAALREARDVADAAIAWTAAGDRLTATKGASKLEANRAFSEAGVSLRKAVKARSQPATPSPAPTYHLNESEQRVMDRALRKSSRLVVSGSSVRADDHEVGQPPPEDVELARNSLAPVHSLDENGYIFEKAKALPAIAAAIASAHLRGERAGLERAADWHSLQMDVAANLELHEKAQFHSDSEDVFRALLPPSTPETKP